jgi:hypothetical protein
MEKTVAIARDINRGEELGLKDEASLLEPCPFRIHGNSSVMVRKINACQKVTPPWIIGKKPGGG